ncbi:MULTISPECIES: hypothetical protein [unclassified Acinetobacter]|uniref:hypothetical protein n=1 Tax=unclassified Acinetobacter TaxID=196816 RepID=UPI0035BA94FE
MTKQFPDCCDFIAKYGCDSIMTADFAQCTTFQYLDKKLVLLTDSYDYIDVKLFLNDNLITHVYDEGIERIVLLDDKVQVFFKNPIALFDQKIFEIVINPHFMVNSITMRSD